MRGVFNRDLKSCLIALWYCFILQYCNTSLSEKNTVKTEAFVSNVCFAGFATKGDECLICTLSNGDGDARCDDLTP